MSLAPQSSAMSSEDYATCAALAAWYATTLPRRVDIVGDFGGKQQFLIDGDSLLLYSITTSGVDYDGKMKPWSHTITSSPFFWQSCFVTNAHPTQLASSYCMQYSLWNRFSGTCNHEDVTSMLYFSITKESCVLPRQRQRAGNTNIK